MSFHTIFVCIGPQPVPTGTIPHEKPVPEVRWVANQLDASEALREIQMWCNPPGEVYACKLSESAAQEIRDAVLYPGSMPRGKAGATPLTLLKRYSQSMQKCADLT